MGSPSLLCLKELLFLCLLLACFDSFARVFIFVIFVGRPFPSLCQTCFFYSFASLIVIFARSVIFVIFVGFPSLLRLKELLFLGLSLA